MNPDILTVIALVLAALGVGSLFVRRMPSAIASYASLVCAHLAGAAAASVRQLVFWGFATIIVMALRMAHSRDAAFSTSSCRYVALGAASGTAVGFACLPASATIILGAVTGSFVGAAAYMTTPASPMLPLTSRAFFEFLGATGLPAAVTCSISAIVAAIIL